MTEEVRQAHQICTAVFVRRNDRVLVVREEKRLLLKPGTVVRRAVLGFPGGGVKEVDFRKVVEGNAYPVALHREGHEEVGLPTFSEEAFEYLGSYGCYRPELVNLSDAMENQPFVLYQVSSIEVPNDFEPSLEKGLEAAWANPENIAEFLAVTPWRMSWMKRAWEEYWGIRPRQKHPYWEVNRPVHENFHPVKVHAR